MAKSFIDMPHIKFTLTYYKDKSVVLEMDGEQVATFSSKFDSPAYIEAQVHQRAKLMRREPGEYDLDINYEGGVKPTAPRAPAGPAVADAENQPVEGVVGTVTEAAPKKRAPRKPKA